MAKRTLALVLVAALTLSFVACGKEKEEPVKEEKSAEEKGTDKEAVNVDFDVNDYVTLGEYKDLEVTINGDYDITDEGYEAYLKDKLVSAKLFGPDDSQTEVLEDSIVNVDYVGSQDGVAFEGGSAEDQTLDVKNNCGAGGGSGYIDGFTAGLVGHSVGEEVAYEVTFPEEYGAENLAGQTVTFTFNINYIAKEYDKDSLTDEIVSENFGYDTVDEFLEGTRKEYEEGQKSKKESDTRTAVENLVVNNATVKGVPEDLLDAWLKIYMNSMEANAKQQLGEDITLKEYFEQVGQDYDQYVESQREGLAESMETLLVFKAIVEAEGLSTTDAGFEDFINTAVKQTNAGTKDKLFSYYTIDGYDGVEYFKLVYCEQVGLDFCVDNAKVNVEAAESEEE
ncbi:MAG: FKBP-type peptidyl-prolyl cis-trans isomerase [Pseudobutyrivibrio sp.]|nr:FKBP-type peptidyl-prolyl cis-trans isomerase [Pseudobutyrivibrio sp.]